MNRGLPGSPASMDDLRAAAAAFPPRTLGAVVFPGFQGLDLWGPLEILGDCAPAVQPLLVGPTPLPVASVQGPSVVPDVTLDLFPPLDLLLIPGGHVAEPTRDRDLLDWISNRATDAEIVMTVGNGAELLAHTGHLDGRRATTNKALFGPIAAAHPQVRWIPSARWVQDGKYMTSSGVSAGIDMAFAVVSQLAGQQLADGLATYIEYERNRDPHRDPFAVGSDRG